MPIDERYQRIIDTFLSKNDNPEVQNAIRDMIEMCPPELQGNFAGLLQSALSTQDPMRHLWENFGSVFHAMLANLESDLRDENVASEKLQLLYAQAKNNRVEIGIRIAALAGVGLATGGIGLIGVVASTAAHSIGKAAYQRHMERYTELQDNLKQFKESLDRVSSILDIGDELQERELALRIQHRDDKKRPDKALQERYKALRLQIETNNKARTAANTAGVKMLVELSKTNADQYNAIFGAIQNYTTSMAHRVEGRYKALQNNVSAFAAQKILQATQAIDAAKTAPFTPEGLVTLMQHLAVISNASADIKETWYHLQELNATENFLQQLANTFREERLSPEERAIHAFELEFSAATTEEGRRVIFERHFPGMDSDFESINAMAIAFAQKKEDAREKLIDSGAYVKNVGMEGLHFSKENLLPYVPVHDIKLPMKQLLHDARITDTINTAFINVVKLGLIAKKGGKDFTESRAFNEFMSKELLPSCLDLSTTVGLEFASEAAQAELEGTARNFLTGAFNLDILGAAPLALVEVTAMAVYKIGHDSFYSYKLKQLLKDFKGRELSTSTPEALITLNSEIAKIIIEFPKIMAGSLEEGTQKYLTLVSLQAEASKMYHELNDMNAALAVAEKELQEIENAPEKNVRVFIDPLSENADVVYDPREEKQQEIALLKATIEKKNAAIAAQDKVIARAQEAVDFVADQRALLNLYVESLDKIKLTQEISIREQVFLDVIKNGLLSHTQIPAVSEEKGIPAIVDFLIKRKELFALLTSLTEAGVATRDDNEELHDLMKEEKEGPFAALQGKSLEVLQDELSRITDYCRELSDIAESKGVVISPIAQNAPAPESAPAPALVYHYEKTKGEKRENEEPSQNSPQSFKPPQR